MLPAFIHGLEPQFISIAHSNFIQIKQSGNELTYLSRLSVLLLIAFLFFCYSLLPCRSAMNDCSTYILGLFGTYWI